MKAHLTFSLTALTVELTEIYSQTSPGPLDDSIERVRRKLSEALEVVIQNAQTNLSSVDGIYVSSSPIEFVQFVNQVRAAILLPATEHVSVFELISSAVESLNTIDVGMFEMVSSILIEQMLSYDSSPRGEVIDASR
jgi:hypothetical protein